MSEKNTEYDPLAVESCHKNTDDQFWQESWYFNFSDPKNNIWGLTRIGYCPFENTADGLFMLWNDGKPAVLSAFIHLNPQDGSKVTIDPPRELKTKGLTFNCKEPLKSWRLINKSSSVDIDLAFEATTPMYMFPELAAKNVKSPASDHYEQSGLVTGTLKFHGKEKTINGTGQRDHSWGPRDWSGIGDWEWLSGQFESGWGFNFWAVGQGADRSVTGFISYPDKNIAIRDGRVDWIGDPKQPQGAKVYLDLEDGSKRVIDYHVQGSWPLTKPNKDGTTMWEMACTYECEGEKGSGISEHLYNDPMGWMKLPGIIWKYGRLAWKCR